MTSSNTLICVGAVAGSYGVHGEIRLKSFCADPMAIEDYVPLLTEDGARSFSLKLTGQVKNGFSAELGGIDTKEAADAIKGLRLFVPRDRLPGLPDDEFYHSDLIGLSVFDTGGRALGKVGAVHNHGAGDLLDVQGPGLSSGVLVPFTLDCVPTVDLGASRVVIDPPEGSFPDE